MVKGRTNKRTRSRSEPRGHMRRRTDRQIIQRNDVLNQFYLNRILQLSKSGEAHTATQVIEATKAFAREKGIPWRL